MATRYEQLLDQAARAAAADTAQRYSAPIPVSPMSTKAMLAVEDRKDRLGQLIQPAQPGTSENEARDALLQKEAGVGEFTSEVRRDMAMMGPAQLYQKYGADASQMMAAMTGANSTLFRQRTQDTRNGFQAIGDVGVDITKALTNVAGGLGTIAGYGIDLASRGASAFAQSQGEKGGPRSNVAGFITNATNQTADALSNLQSNQLQERRKATDSYKALLADENRLKTEGEVAQGTDPFVASLRRLGRGIFNAADGMNNDSAVLGSDLVNAGASMLAVGPIAKGLTAAIKVPSTTLASRALGLGPNKVSVNNALAFEAAAHKLADKIAVPAAIGLMEGGSGAGDTLNQVMRMTPEELAANSQDYRDMIAEGIDPETARLNLAQNATGPATLATGIVGGLSGKLVAGFEGQGLAGIARAGLRKATTREFFEEGIQGAAQPLATNIAIEQTADDDRAAAEGVGESAAEGALLGSLSAGILAAPGSAARNTGKAAVGTAKLAGKLAFKGTVAGLTKAREVIGPLLVRGTEAASEAATKFKERAPLSEKSMRNAFDIVAAKAGETAQILTDAISNASDKILAPETKQKLVEYGQRITSRSSIAPEEATNEALHPEVQSTISTSKDRLEAIDTLAAIGNDETKEPAVRMSALAEMAKMIEQTEDVLAEGKPFYEGLGKINIPEVAVRELKRLNEVYSQVRNMPQVKKALGSIGTLATSLTKPKTVEVTETATPTLRTRQEVVDELDTLSPGQDQERFDALTQELGTIETAESAPVAKAPATRATPTPVDVANTIAAAKYAPDKVDPEAIDDILEHNEDGKIVLSKDETKTLELGRTISRASKEYTDKAEVLGRNAKRSPNVVSKGIVVGEGDEVAPSAIEHMQQIRDALQRKEIEPAKATMKRLTALARTLQNKVDALNRYYASDLDPNLGNENGFTFKNTTVGGRRRQSDTLLWVNPKVPASVQLAQRVENDARAVAFIQNELARLYPELETEGLKPLALVAGLQGDVAEIVAKANDRTVKTEDVSEKALGTAEESGPVVLPVRNSYTKKDQAKSDRANKFIGRGSARSSTNTYAEAWGENANSGKYEATDTVFISAEGNRNGRSEPNFAEIRKAIDAGATLITDVKADRNRSYNIGEREVATYLAENGYAESKPGEWTKNKTVAPAKVVSKVETEPDVSRETPPSREPSQVEALAKIFNDNPYQNEKKFWIDFNDKLNQLSSVELGEALVLMDGYENIALIGPNSKTGKLLYSAIDALSESIGFDLKNLINDFYTRTGSRLGGVYSYIGTSIILSQEWLDTATSEDARRVLSHELGHAIDWHSSTKHQLVSYHEKFNRNGALYNEFFQMRKDGSIPSWVAEPLWNYINTSFEKRNSNEEFFAELASFVMLEPGLAQELIPNGYKAIDEIIASRRVDKKPVSDKSSESGRSTPTGSDQESDANESTPTEEDITSVISDDLFKQLGGWVDKAFSVPKISKSRLFGLEAPIAAVQAALKSAAAQLEFIGKGELNGKLTDEVATGYEPVFAEAAKLKAFLKDNLREEFLDKESPEGMTFEEHIIQGVPMKRKNSADGILKEDELYDILVQPNGKAANLLVEKDGKLVYHEGLLDAAVLASLQWSLVPNRYTRRIDLKAGAAILNLPFDSDAAPYLKRLRAGMGPIEIKSSLAEMIQKFWGLNQKDDADLAMAQGIVEGMAGELMLAMIATKALEQQPPIIITAKDAEGKNREVNRAIRYAPRKFAEEDPVIGYPTAIEDAVLVEPEPEFFIGSPPKNVPTTQMNNHWAELTQGQQRAVRSNNGTIYKINQTLTKFTEKLGKDLYIRLYGENDLEGRIERGELNVEHGNTLLGRNATKLAGFETHNRLVAKLDNLGDREADIHYAHGIAKNGRLQQLGHNSPQTNKNNRELVLPTESTNDLSSKRTPDAGLYQLALAQMLGVKVHNFQMFSPEGTVKQLNDELTRLKPVIELLTKYHIEDMAGREMDITAKDIDMIVTTFGKAPSAAAFHAVFDYARLQATPEADRKAFKTQVYIEADGVSNGIVNAIMMVTHGGFTRRSLTYLRKGGIFMSKRGFTMNEQGETDKIDYYGVTSAQFRREMATLRRQLNDSPETQEQLDNILALMLQFDRKGVTIGNPGDTIPTFDRGFTKNPMMITLYGSGAKGIAGNLVNDLMTLVYAEMSNAAANQSRDKNMSNAEALFGQYATANNSAEKQYAEFTKLMNSLTHRTVHRAPWSYSHYEITNEKGSLGTINPQSFKLSRSEREAFQENMTLLVVRPLRNAIYDTVGEEVQTSMDVIRDGTNIQSIFLKHAYTNEINRLIAERKLKPGQFLSKQDLEKIFDTVIMKLFPFIETNDQRFLPGGTERMKLEGFNLEFGRSLKGLFRTDGSFRGLEASGVGGIAQLIQGLGDAFMVQTFSVMNDMVPGTLPIFDGIHLPLSQAVKGSQQLNKAAFEAMMNNPVRAVADTYGKFLKVVDLTQISNDSELTMELYEALNMKDTGATEKQLLLKMKVLQYELNKMAASIDARHTVIRRIKGLTIDQMAAVGAPYEQAEGDIDLQGLTDEAAEKVLNTAYNEEYAKFAKLSAPELAPEFATVLKRVSTLAGTGVRRITHNGLKRLLVNLDIPVTQKQMLSEIVNGLSTQKYSVITGDMNAIDTWTRDSNLQPPSKLDESLKGYISFKDKNIYVSSGTAETLVHELIHASTFEKIVAFYRGKKSTPETKDAIKRIELLMEQFMTLSANTKTGDQDALINARNAIEQYATKEQTPLNKAKALNEFMAWALANEQLATKLSKEDAVKGATFLGMAKKVFAALKQLVFGKRAGIKPATDMLSNLQFNTLIVANSAPNLMEQISSTMNHDESVDSLRVSNFEKIYHSLITANLEELDLEDVDVDAAAKYEVQTDTAILNAQEISNTFIANGFPMTDEERGLFEMTVAAFGTAGKFNANSLVEVAQLYDHVVKELSPTMFLESTAEDATLAEEAMAQNRYDLVVGNTLVKQDAFGRSTLMPAFLALSMVSEDFRKVLEKIKPPTPELAKWNSMDGALDNIGTQMMYRLSKAMSGSSKNAPNMREAMAILSGIIQNVATNRKENRLESVLTSAHNLIDKANKVTVDLLLKGSDLAITGIDRFAALAPDSKAMRLSTNILKTTASLVNEKQSEAMTTEMMSGAMSGNMWNSWFSLLNEIVGRTLENKIIYDLIKLVRATIDAARQQYREALPKMLAKRFVRTLTDKQNTHLYNGMGRSDLAAIVDNGFTRAATIDLLKDMDNISAEIERSEKATKKLIGSNWNKIQEKSKQLAHFMNTKELGPNILRNAEAIAHLYSEPEFVAGFTPTQEQIKAIDKLVSLYALDGLSQETKDTLSVLAREETEGMDFLLANLAARREVEMTKVARSDIARANHYKGYMPSEAKTGHDLIIARDAKEGAYLKMTGYIRVGEYTPSNIEPRKANDVRGYYYSSVGGRGKYLQGLIQNIRATASGVDPITGYTNDAASHGGQIIDELEIKRITQANARTGHTNGSPLIAIHNLEGEVVGYERSVDPKEDARVLRNTHLGDMIGAWRGRQMEEDVAAQFNARVLANLKTVYDRDMKLGRGNEYVNLFDTKMKDPIFRDAVSLLNKETKSNIEDTFQKGEFWVRKDMIDDVIGYRAASIGDSWTGVSRWPKAMQDGFKEVAEAAFGKNAYRYLMMAEKYWHNFITDARVTIVVKSVIVPMFNLAANFLQLLSRGVPIHHIVKGMPKKTAEVHAYTKARLRRIEIEAEIDASTNASEIKKLKLEMQTIDDMMRHLSIWPLIKAGEFASISDTVVSREEMLMSEGRLSGFLEQLTEKVPGQFKTAARYAAVTKSTSLFKGLQKAVEYGDFLGKAVMYDFLTERKGMSSEEALGRITEEFINYDRVPGRARNALEANGLIWFWHFKLRAMKIGVSLLRNNPVHLFLAMVIPGLFGMELPGSPALDNGAAVVMDGPRMAHSMGIGQAASAHLLHPTANLAHKLFG